MKKLGDVAKPIVSKLAQASLHNSTLTGNVRKRSEIIEYRKQDIEELVKFAAKMRVIGGCFIGSIDGQEIRNLPDGGIAVITHVTEAGWRS